MAYFTITRKSKKRCLRVESPHQDVVECILERVPVKSLLRFKSVSKQWKSTIESRFFQTRQLMRRQQSGDPDVLMVSVSPYNVKANIVRPGLESLRTLVLGSSSSVKIPTPWENKYLEASYSTCDGLVCLYTHFKSGFVVNPTTRWHRPLPLSNLQQLVTDLHYLYPLYKLGFGKDKFTGTYKPVWLYTSAEIGLENATTCEVFDFHTNAWRYVTPAAPYRILPQLNPVFVDGLLHWFTDCKETKLVSFDLHTEAFEVVSKAPFANVDLLEIVMCNLDNRLCVSHKTWPNQVIWSFHSRNKTWDKMYSLDLDLTNYWHDMPTLLMPCALVPLALLDGEKKMKKTKKKKKLMLYDRLLSQTLLTHDPETKSYEAAFSAVPVSVGVLLVNLMQLPDGVSFLPFECCITFS